MASFTGGATVGWVNATFPFGHLEARPERLRLRVSLIGSYEFRPEDVVAVEEKRGFLSSGVRIRHAVGRYPRSLVFLPLGSARGVVEAVRAAGFVPKAPAEAEIQRRPVPFRWSAAAVCVLVWNGLFLWDLGHPWSVGRLPRPGLGVLAGLAFAFTVAWGLKLAPALRGLFLKPGRDFEEIKPFVNLCCLILSLMLPIFALIRVVAPIP